MSESCDCDYSPDEHGILVCTICETPLRRPATEGRVSL